MRKALLVVILAGASAFAGTVSGSLSFSNTPLLRPEGESEPAVAVANDGTVAVTGLQWLFNPSFFGTHFWTGPFGATPTFQGLLDSGLRQPGKIVFGSGDADFDIGSNNTLHATTLMFFINPTFRTAQIGVSAVICPNVTSASFTLQNCTRHFVDRTESDRDWISSDGPHVYISYHDSGSSTLIHVQRSDDDGFTFHRVTDPITGQGGATGNSTFNNDQGKLIADSFSHNVYTVWASGVSGLQKGTTANFNNIYVTVSPDMGKTWTPHLVFSGTINVALNNVFPALAVDPLSGTLYAGWSDAHHVFISKSTDQGNTWTSPLAVNTSPANTAVFPWIVARGSTVDYVYYGTNTSSKDDPRAVWNVYMAQSSDSGSHFAQSTVTARPNHVCVICTNGTGCARGTRNLLDLFQDAIDPLNGLAAIIST